MPAKSVLSKSGRSGESLYKLKITLEGSNPLIWRRLVVLGKMTLDRLHDVFQVAMGWEDDHLHRFVAGSAKARKVYQSHDPMFGGDDGRTLDEAGHRVAELAAPPYRFLYEYDFGDGWEHDVVIEIIMPPDNAFTHSVCIDGENACPPEDCGGIYGYEYLCEIMADPKHPDHDERKEWVGDDFDPTKFSADEVTAALKRYAL